MPRKPYHHPDLKAQLLAETRHLVEKAGPESVTLARVAKACDVSVAAPYRHFDNKEALLSAVAGIGFAELREAISESVVGLDDGGARLVAAGVAYVEYAGAHPHLFRLMFSADLRDRLAAVGPATLEALTQIIAPLRLQVSPDVAVRTAWALAHGLAALRTGGMLTFTDGDSAQRLRAELRVVLTGILADREVDLPEAGGPEAGDPEPERR